MGFGCHKCHGLGEGKDSDGGLKQNKTKERVKGESGSGRVLPEMIPNMYYVLCSLCFFFLNSFIELYFTYLKLHLWQLYNSIILSILSLSFKFVTWPPLCLMKT